MTKIWVTKDALTSGIFSFEGEISANGIATFTGKGIPIYYYPYDYEITLEEALAKAENMRIKQLNSLQRRIDKLRDNPIKVIDND